MLLQFSTKTRLVSQSFTVSPDFEFYFTSAEALKLWILFNGISVQRRRSLPLSSNCAPTTSFSTTTLTTNRSSSLLNTVIYIDSADLHCINARQHRFPMQQTHYNFSCPTLLIPQLIPWLWTDQSWDVDQCIQNPNWITVSPTLLRAISHFRNQLRCISAKVLPTSVNSMIFSRSLFLR